MDDEGFGLVQHFQKGVHRALELEMLLEKMGFSGQLIWKYLYNMDLESPK